MSRTLQLTEQLIARPSLTPDDQGCQSLMAERLEPLGFVCETIASGPENFRVTNLWALRPSTQAHNRTLVWAGHTDVVPTGPLANWSSDPFTPSHRDGRLYGRGASDMKTSLAAMVVATEDFLAAHPDTSLNLAFLLTSDEEGPSVDGTVIVCEALKSRQQVLDWCIVGEPTSVENTGDMIKNGRRGSLTGKLSVQGIQGHIAYPQLARNPIHQLAPALAELVALRWDEGNAFFPPTSWQVSNIHAGTGVGNVIPGEVVVDFNFRFSTESSVQSLKDRLTAVLDRNGLTYQVQWTLGGSPFLTQPGELSQAVQAAILAETGIRTELSTTGGTSDGRFISQICPQVIELGPPNASIHQVNENVRLQDIEPLKNIYQGVLERLERQVAAQHP